MMSLLSLKLRTWYRIHKWTAVIAGLALLMWLVTGLTLTWGRIFPPPQRAESSQYDYRLLHMSPAEATQNLAEKIGREIRVSWLSIRPILDTIVYEIQLMDGSIYLMDAISGQVLEITPQLAELIAWREWPIDADVQSVTRLESNSVSYPYGPVPVYQVALNDDRQTRLYVSTRTGEILRSDRAGRTRTLLNSLHTFDALRIVTDRRRLITGLLVLASMTALAVPLLGYYLALPRRWQFLNRRK
jgi:uncharacterized iron-regulated membrane protein